MPPVTLMPSPVARGRGITRTRDREITIAGIAVAAGYLALAMLAALAGGGDAWLPLHLALAGGASAAIAAVLPFFAASLVQVAPAAEPQRIAAVVLVTVGAGGVTLGWRMGNLGLAALGGAVYLLGMALVLAMTVILLRRSLGASRRIFQVLYGAAVACVLAGATLSTLMLAGVPAVQSAWGSLRVAHAWLNLFGFVGLVIAATLIHFYPTVVGCRIGGGRVFLLGIGALAAGPPLAALGFALSLQPAVAAGSLMVLAGCVALVWYAVDVQRRRARWTTDRDWHRFAIGSLSASMVWLVAAMGLASIVAIVHGPGGTGWIDGVVALPLVVGSVVQVIVGSWTHLVPAIGPGDQAHHAWQRRLMGRWALPRLLAFQAGTAVLVAAAAGRAHGTLETASLLLVAMPIAASLALLAVALVTGPRTSGRS